MEKISFSNIYVNIKTRTSKNENTLYLLILDKIKSEKIEDYTDRIELDISTINISKDKISDTLDGLLDKKIEIFYDENNINTKLTFSYISSYVIKSNKVIVTLPQPIFNCFKKNTLEYNISLKTFFYLRNRAIINFFNLLIKNLEQTKDIEFNLENLKSILNINEDSYDRFFDFEKNTLKPITEKINAYSNFKIEYSKIKKGENKNNKVIGIKFYIKNTEIIKCKSETVYLTQIIKNMISNYSDIWQAVNESIIHYGFEETKRNILFLKENTLQISDEEIKHYLKNNGRNIEEILKISNHMLIKEKYGIYKNVNTFIKTIYDIIIGYDFYYSLNFKFLSVIKNYKEGENFYYNDSTYIIFGNYYENKGYFKIFEAKDKF